MKKWKFETWNFENLFVLAILSVIAYYTGNSFKEWFGAAAVFFTFCHVSISERMREKQKFLNKNKVDCANLLIIFFLLKESFWLIYFVTYKVWAALAGCILFIAYPIWRKLYRIFKPLKLET